MYPLSNTWCFRIPDDRTLNCTAESLAAKAVRTLKQSPHQSRAEQTQIEVLAQIPSDGCTTLPSAGAATSSGGSATWMSTGTALKKHVLDCTIWRRRTMLCLPVHMPTSQRVPPRAATGPDSSVVVLRFIFALAVHTATTTAATVSVKEGADESHRQLGASDCKQRVGQEQSAGSCCNFCDNPGNGVDKPWWRPGANAKCDRDDLACAGCSECKTKHCRQREGHDQSAGSCCNFCALGRMATKKRRRITANGNKKAPHCMNI